MNRLFKSLSSESINENEVNDMVLSSSSEKEVKIKPRRVPKMCKLQNDESSVSIVSNFSSGDITFTRGSFRFCMTDNQILLVFHPMFLCKLLHAKKLWVDCQRDFCKTRTFLSMLINHSNSVTFIINDRNISYYIDNHMRTRVIDDSYNSLNILLYKLNMSIQNEYDYTMLLEDFFKRCVDILYYIS